MDAKKLHGFIWNGIKAEEKNGCFELTLPFPISEKPSMFTVIWKEIKAPKLSDYAKKLRAEGYTVERGKEFTSYDISDGGRIISELENRLGDISPYRQKISDILKDTGTFELSGGRIIHSDYTASSPHYHTMYLNTLLLIASLISNIDILPYTKGEFERGEANA